VEIYADARGWIPVEVIEDYEQEMQVSYLSENVEAAKAPDTSTEKEEESTQDEEETSEETAGEKSEATETATEMTTETVGQGETGAGDAEMKNGMSVRQRFLRGGLLALVLVLFILVLWSALRWRRHQQWENRWKNSPDHSYCVRMWYHKLFCLMAVVKGANIYNMEDNRMSHVKEVLMQIDPALDPAAMERSMEIRQKATYAAEGITKEEREEACAFFIRETDCLWDQISLVKKWLFLHRNYKKTE
jgi:hypothetical protein